MNPAVPPEPRFAGKALAMHRLPANQRISILPGAFAVVQGPWILSTLLGSCVAVCLYDAEARVAGMNHFLLPVDRFPTSGPLGLTQAGRYGIQAMELLINGLLHAGASKARLQAKLFGGASVLQQAIGPRWSDVGGANARFAREFLSIEGIPVVAEGLAGDLGRVIHFHTDTFSVWCRVLRNQALKDRVLAEESGEWNRATAKLRASGSITLFD